MCPPWSHAAPSLYFMTQSSNTVVGISKLSKRGDLIVLIVDNFVEQMSFFLCCQTRWMHGPWESVPDTVRHVNKKSPTGYWFREEVV
jgi:hypothetical protein